MNSRTLDNTTAASTPGTIQITRFAYARYFGEGIVDFMGRLVGSFSRKNVRWVRAQEHFRFGDVNPAIVLDAKMGLVAVFTDLDSKLQKRFPVVKVKKEKLHLIRHSPVKNGCRLAAVSLYARSPETATTGMWGGFSPIVIDCVVHDKQACATALERITPISWVALELGTEQLPSPLRPGLFAITLSDEVRNQL